MAINVFPEKCDRCGTCISVCRSNAIMLLTDSLVIDHAACTGCQRCVAICPFGALTFSSGSDGSNRSTETHTTETVP